MRDVSAEDIKKEWALARGQMTVIGVAAATLLSTGAIFFHITEKLSWVNAYYFCTITLTTVGYGDFVPKTPAEKIFIMFYILIGIGIVATFANLMIKSSALRREYKRALRHEEKSAK